MTTKIKVGVIILLLMSAPHTIKADFQQEVIISTGGGIVSGYLLTRAYAKMDQEGLSSNAKVLSTVVLAAVAHGIRNVVLPIKDKQAQAMGLLAALCTFFGYLGK